MSELKEGDVIGHVMAWGISETKGGKPQVYVQFDIGKTWHGHLTEKSMKITLNALVTMGFRGDDLADLVRNPVDALDKNKDLRLKLENEEFEGKTRLKIQWINEIAGPMKGQLDEAGALKALSNLKVAGDLMKIRQDKGVTSAAAPVTSSDIPF